MNQTVAATRSFLLSVLPKDTEVVRGQANRVPAPKAQNYVVLTDILGTQRLSTNITEYSDGGANGPQEKFIKQPMQIVMQVDFHGPEASDYARIVSTMFRDPYGVNSFTDSGFAVAPLFCSDSRQIPFLNDSQQIETRWTLDLTLQANPVVTIGQEFADSLKVFTQEVDAFAA